MYFFFLVGFLLGHRTPSLCKCSLVRVTERAARNLAATSLQQVFPGNLLRKRDGVGKEKLQRFWRVLAF